MRELLLSIAVASIACSSGASNDSAGSDAAKDAAPDGPSLDAANDADENEASPLPTCGAPPYVNYELRAGEILATGATQPLAGASLTFDLCPELSLTTDSDGFAFAQVTRGTAFNAKISAADHVTILVAEQVVLDFDPTDVVRVVQLLPRMDAIGDLPGYDPSKPSLAIVIQPDATSIHCKDPSGVTLSLPDHPEATAVYMRPDWPRDPTPTVTDTSAGPVIFFTGITPANTIVNGVKGLSGPTSPCLVVEKTAHQTGRFRVEPGAWTVGNVFFTE